MKQVGGQRSQRRADKLRTQLGDAHVLRKVEEGHPETLRITTCYNFAWSRELWSKAARNITRTCLVMAIVYVSSAIFINYVDGKRGIDIFYLMAQTLLTVREIRQPPSQNSTVLTRQTPNHHRPADWVRRLISSKSTCAVLFHHHAPFWIGHR